MEDTAFSTSKHVEEDAELKKKLPTEFRILVHGPFATNICLDLSELEELDKFALDRSEVEILKCIGSKARTEKSITSRVERYRVDSTSIRKLQSKGMLELQKPTMKSTLMSYFGYRSEPRYSLTMEGLHILIFHLQMEYFS